MLDLDKEVTKASFYRYWYDRRVCAAVVICKDHYEVGLAFKNPLDQLKKKTARTVAFGRIMTGKSIPLTKEDVAVHGIFGALVLYIKATIQETSVLEDYIKYGTNGKILLYEDVANKLGMPVRFVHQMRKENR